MSEYTDRVKEIGFLCEDYQTRLSKVEILRHGEGDGTEKLFVRFQLQQSVCLVESEEIKRSAIPKELHETVMKIQAVAFSAPDKSSMPLQVKHNFEVATYVLTSQFNQIALMGETTNPKISVGSMYAEVTWRVGAWVTPEALTAICQMIGEVITVTSTPVQYSIA